MGAEGRRKAGMNDVRRRALRSAFWLAVLMAPAWTYLWFVDYRGAAFPPGFHALFLGYLSPLCILMMRSGIRLWLGRHLGPDAPYLLR